MRFHLQDKDTTARVANEELATEAPERMRPLSSLGANGSSAVSTSGTLSPVMVLCKES